MTNEDIIRDLVQALIALADECEAEFSVDGEWFDDGTLVRQDTVERARSAIKRAAHHTT